jgi:hypothetical protein
MQNRKNDRFSIYSDHENEVRSLAHKLRYPVDDILVAIQEVGFDEAEIEEYIRDRYERGMLY